jgi:unsaturated chondroitin disaccharide hydrolase
VDAQGRMGRRAATRRRVRRSRLGLHACLWLALAACLYGAASARAALSTSFAAEMRAAQRHATARVMATERETPAGFYPYYTRGTAWRLSDAGGWTSGYVAGESWLAYQMTAIPWWQRHARSREAAIGAAEISPAILDLGVRYYPSYVRGYRLTGDRRLKAVALRAASSLAARYDPTVGAVRCRPMPDYFFVNVDSLLDLDLLWWGAAHGGPDRWARAARRHALTIARDFVRPDGSTYHFVLYDETTGEVLERRRGQGYSTDSMWARGQAWAVYGFADAYRHTREPAFLDVARRVADRYLADLPADWVPYWDFRAPGIPDEPRDSSAAAVAASGLIDLALLEPDPARAERYEATARATLDALASDAYSSSGELPSVLLHGTLNYWSGTVDRGLAYGDYFYLEAMLRLRRLAPQAPRVLVTGSQASAGDPALALDSDPATAWSTKGHQWLDLDLGTACTVAAVRVALRGGYRRGAAKLRILTSADRTVWTLAKHTMAGGETSGFETYDFSPRQARWVRVECFGTTLSAWNHLKEVEVVGIDDEAAPQVALRQR